MDPTVTWYEINYLISKINLGQVTRANADDYRENLTDHVENLASWLATGGFAPDNLPADWRQQAADALARLDDLPY